MQSTTLSLPVPDATLRLRLAETDGTPMVLLHGGPGGTDYLFKFVAVQLAHAGYRAVGLIQRGGVGSPAKRPPVIRDFIDDVEAVRRHLSAPRIALMGHSWGGFLATLYAAHYPEAVERVVLVCPVGPRAGWKHLFDAEIERRIPETERARFHELARLAAETTDENEWQRLMFERANISVFSYYAPSRREGMPGLASLNCRIRESIAAEFPQWWSRSEWEEGLKRVDAPTSLLWGEDDVTPEVVVGMYEDLFPGIEVVRFPRVGHFPWMEEPASFHAALDRVLGVAKDSPAH